jgi:hypothetical protein
MRSLLTIRIASITLLALAAVTASSDAFADKHKRKPAEVSPTTAPSTTPKPLVGKWMYGSVSPTTYWDADTGVFQGNARGSSGIYEFDDAGHYKEYIYLELRTGNFTSKAWTVHEGTVAFTNDHFTLHVERGHYQFWANNRLTTDRDMKPDECAKLSKTYAWTFGKNDAGEERFTVPFEDGSKMEYRRQTE